MLKLFKYLKKSIFTIIIIVILLFLQAMCDLALPEYTSKIVNVGIQQSGVENACPDVIRRSEMDKILLVTSENDKIIENFTLLNKKNMNDEEYNSYINRYPAIQDEELYVLNDIDKETLEELEPILSKAILIVSVIENGGEQMQQMAGQLMQNLPQGMESTDIFDILKVLPNEEKLNILDSIDEKITEMPEMIIKQAAIQFVKNEYSEIGIDTDKMQTNYIIYSRSSNARFSTC